ncbi:MAG: response regulator [Desulfuromonadaceae bacterium]|nr:response regulator [Desulfuromonadaceae bacterium]
MLEPKVIIADKNLISRAGMARALAAKIYTVEYTGSAASLMESLLHDGSSVVVLGDGLEEGLSVASLVTLLKSCSRHSTIILVADEVSASEELKVRQQGIFYRTNRPVCALGWDELQQAIDCARNKVMLATRAFRPHCNRQGVEQPEKGERR